MEWVRYYFNAAPSPWLYTSLAVVGVGWSVIKIRRGFTSAKAIRQGRDGERAVAQYLERFRAHGFQVFDVQFFEEFGALTLGVHTTRATGGRLFDVWPIVLVGDEVVGSNWHLPHREKFSVQQSSGVGGPA